MDILVYFKFVRPIFINFSLIYSIYESYFMMCISAYVNFLDY